MDYPPPNEQDKPDGAQDRAFGRSNRPKRATWIFRIAILLLCFGSPFLYFLYATGHLAPKPTPTSHRTYGQAKSNITLLTDEITPSADEASHYGQRDGRMNGGLNLQYYGPP
jgi:hypothetical protein